MMTMKMQTIRSDPRSQYLLNTIYGQISYNAYCDITWAMAAPLTPRWKTKMNNGSSIMFVTSPATTIRLKTNFNESKAE